MEGYIKFHRTVLENPIICKDSDYFAVWGYLLLSATHTNYDVVFNNKRITLRAGQLITGRKSISEFYKISESKVQRILKTFENEQQIEQQTCSRNRLITVLNWDNYQNTEHLIEQRVNNKRTTSEQQVNNKRTTSEQQVNTNNNVNNIKNDNNVKECKNEKKKPPKHKHGEYSNVLLTDDELIKLKNDYQNTDELITYLDEYIEMKGYKAKSHYLAIKKWVVDAVTSKQVKERKETTSVDWSKL